MDRDLAQRLLDRDVHRAGDVHRLVEPGAVHEIEVGADREYEVGLGGDLRDGRVPHHTRDAHDGGRRRGVPAVGPDGDHGTRGGGQFRDRPGEPGREAASPSRMSGLRAARTSRITSSDGASGRPGTGGRPTRPGQSATWTSFGTGRRR
ncbi:hypothetical protein MTP03_23780 [Tsukamurella sp. PLM1]|nr:hypothetical protein [Tsukamurella sp. PLM1]BDH57439.1 hypothetical protein MTP03_23780 [Tsukamurella sp. PLM1]